MLCAVTPDKPGTINNGLLLINNLTKNILKQLHHCTIFRDKSAKP